MKKDDFDFVALRDLRIGLLVDLEVGWMAHPFASSRFKISSDKQIEILKGLGLARIRYVPAQSDPAIATAQTDSPLTNETEPASPTATKANDARTLRRALRAAQQQTLAVCERRFAESAKQYRKALDLLHTHPLAAAQQCQGMVQTLVSDMLQQGDTAIRLLTDAAGDKVAMHPVNVTVISLLLGRAMGLLGPELENLGVAALLHDIGKTALPERVHRPDDSFSSTDHKVYQDHVPQGVRLATQMQLSPSAIESIAQHHEMADGSGFPLRLKGDAIGAGARILALVNRYDGLCNPYKAGAALTPHEALALIFAQQKTRFDAVALSTFIRLMGVYPPGSVVQLNDERHALVVSVNSGRPLKPCLMVFDSGVPRHEAVLLDLEHAPKASIRRSLKPSSLPAAAQDYLQPRKRICYFIETAADAPELAEST